MDKPTNQEKKTQGRGLFAPLVAIVLCVCTAIIASGEWAEATKTAEDTHYTYLAEEYIGGIAARSYYISESDTTGHIRKDGRELRITKIENQ